MSRVVSSTVTMILLISASAAYAAPSDWAAWGQTGSINVGHGHLTQCDISPDGRLALVVSEEEALIRIYGIATKKSVDAYSIPGVEPYDALYAVFWPLNPESPRVLCSSKAGLALYDISGTLVQSLVPGPAQRMRWSPDRTLLMCLEFSPDKAGSILRLYRAGAPAALTQIDRWEAPDRITAWDMNRANDKLAVATLSDQVSLVDWKTKRSLWTAPGPKYANAISILPDGAKIACGGDHVTLYDAQTPSKTSTYAAFNNNIDTIAFAPTGDAMAVSAYDGRIRVLGTDLAQPALPLLKELKHGGTANVYGLVFYANGTRLMSSSGDRTIRFWGAVEKTAADTKGK
ncbi:MAG: hypothetical protein HZB26_03565 [Candidatus Hydrogenedentes bacterium]|nr:hypothetical protein [Candidatus Hydrogenedentota bacterium]